MEMLKMRTSMDTWKEVMKILYGILKLAKEQEVLYAENAIKLNYFSNKLFPELIEKLCKKHNFVFEIDGRHIKKQIMAKYQAINECFFEKQLELILKDKNKKVLFKHQRLDKLIRLLTTTDKKKQFVLGKNQIIQILAKNLKKNLSDQYISLMGYMIVNSNKNQKEGIIEVNKLPDQKNRVLLQFQPVFDKAQIQSYLKNKGFDSVAAERMVKNARGYFKYNDTSDLNSFYEGLKMNEFENVSLAFNVLGICLNLEHVNNFLKERKISEYMQRWGLIEGFAIAKGIICGMLSGLKDECLQSSMEMDIELNEDEQEVYKQFVQFFQGIFNEDNEENDEVKKIVRGINNKKMKNNNRQTTQQIIIQEWVG